MHGNLKVMLKSSVKCRYILQIQTENDIANIVSRLNCEFERFGEIYAVMVIDDKFTVQLRKIWHNLCMKVERVPCQKPTMGLLRK